MHNGHDRKTINDEIRQAFGSIPGWLEEIPDHAIAGFWQLMRDVYLAETTIPNKYKDFIGLGVSAATRCRYCTLFHTESARLHGATDAEIAEASTMAGITMFASTFLNSQQYDYDRFHAETMKIVGYVKSQQPGGARPGAGDAHA